ncbi:hypothetical protein SDJN02_18126, partial [Cucurbita argyrosperma subsp. argyrosperma]
MNSWSDIRTSHVDNRNLFLVWFAHLRYVEKGINELIGRFVGEHYSGFVMFPAAGAESKTTKRDDTKLQ